MVDTLDLKSNSHYGCAGSSPAPGTYKTPTYWLSMVGFFVYTTLENIALIK